MAPRTRREPDRYQWSQEARRVQSLAAGWRVFDHEGHAHMAATLADLERIVAEIHEHDAECSTRIAAELAARGIDLTPNAPREDSNQ